MGAGEPCQTPHQGSQCCSQYRCCMSIHPRAIDHFQGFLELHWINLLPILSFQPYTQSTLRTPSLLSRLVLRLHPSVFASKAPLQLPPNMLYITSYLRLPSRAGIHLLPSTGQNRKADIGVWVRQRRKRGGRLLQIREKQGQGNPRRESARHESCRHGN